MIFKESFNSGKHLLIWRISQVTPVKKARKNKGKAESFRHVAITCLMGKILEVRLGRTCRSFWRFTISSLRTNMTSGRAGAASPPS